MFSKNFAPYTESSFQTRPATRNTGGKHSDHQDHHPAFCHSAATDSFWRTRARQPKMKLGGNCQIATCIGPHISINAAKNGHPNGIAFVATTPSHWNTPCFNTSQPNPSAHSMGPEPWPSTCAATNVGGSAPGAPTFNHARQLPCQQQRQRPHTAQTLPYHIGSGKGHPGTATSAPLIVGFMSHCSTPGRID